MGTILSFYRCYKWDSEGKWVGQCPTMLGLCTFPRLDLFPLKLPWGGNKPERNAMGLRTRHLFDSYDDLENLHVLRWRREGLLVKQCPGPLSLASASSSQGCSHPLLHINRRLEPNSMVQGQAKHPFTEGWTRRVQTQHLIDMIAESIGRKYLNGKTG